MKTYELHIGIAIQKRVQELNISDAEFARRINTSRQNVQSIYIRKSVDSFKLFKISKVLDFDFFSLYNIDKTQKLFDNIKTKNAKIVIEFNLENDDLQKLGLKDRVLELLK